MALIPESEQHYQNLLAAHQHKILPYPDTAEAMRQLGLLWWYEADGWHVTHNGYDMIINKLQDDLTGCQSACEELAEINYNLGIPPRLPKKRQRGDIHD